MFKKSVSSVLIVALLLFCGCGNTSFIDGIEYDTRGLIHMVTDDINPDIEYRVIWGNVIWGGILSATIIAPIYFFGFSMFEPIGKKNPNAVKGTTQRQGIILRPGNEFERKFNQ